MKIQLVNATGHVVIQKIVPTVLERTNINVAINRLWDEFKARHHAGWMYIDGAVHSYSESLRGVPEPF